MALQEPQTQVRLDNAGRWHSIPDHDLSMGLLSHGPDLQGPAPADALSTSRQEDPPPPDYSRRRNGASNVASVLLSDLLFVAAY